MLDETKRIERIVLTGGPSSGKTTVIEELGRRGNLIIPEAARQVISVPSSLSGSEKSRLIYEVQKEAEEQIQGRAFLDRSQIDGIAYMKHFHGDVLSGTKLPEYRYDAVFVLERLPFVDDGIRIEKSDAEAQERHDLVVREYLAQGYTPIYVPTFPGKTVEEEVAKRANFILENC